MLKFEYCKLVNAKAVPTGPDWIHEIKYDGYRGRIVRDGKDVRLLSSRLLSAARSGPNCSPLLAACGSRASCQRTSSGATGHGRAIGLK